MTPLPRLAGPSLDAGATPASSIGVALTAHASNNTKASTWTEVIASTVDDVAWMMIQFSGNATAGKYLVDIGVGASTAEQTLIPNLYAYSAAGAARLNASYVFPISVPKGTRISARSQCSVGASGSNIAIQTLTRGAAGIGGLSRVETFGADTTTSNIVPIDAGGTINTDSTPYTQLIATTGFDYRWVNLVLDFNDNTTAIVSNWLVDIALGAAASEVNILNDLWLTIAGGADAGPVCISIPLSITAGSRISARARCAHNTAADRIVVVGGWGVG